MNIFNFKERKEQKKQKEFQEKMRSQQEKRILRNYDKSNAINKKSLELLSDSINNSQDLQVRIKDFNKQVADFQKLVDENQKLQQQLQEQQQRLTDWEEDLKNKAEENRKKEITLHIQSEGVKKDQQRLEKKDRALDEERADILRRETKAAATEKDCTQKKEEYEEKSRKAEKKQADYDAKINNLKSREEECKKSEADLKKRSKDVKSKEDAFAKKEKEFEAVTKTEKEDWEKECAEIKASLEEKIKEYDLKLADMKDATDTFDSLKFDESAEGKDAKIVVKEAIRAGMKQLEDTLQNFRKLDEQYASGTFKGFAVPFDEISTVIEELKVQYAAVKEHAEATGLDFSIWLNKIEAALLEANKNVDSYLFAAGYKAAMEGLAYCKGYADMISIFNEYSSEEDSGSGESEPEQEETDWPACFSVLFEEEYNPEFDYLNEMTLEEFKKQYRKLARKYHPDLADQEKKEFFEEKTKEINEIWEKIKAYFCNREAA